MSGSTRHKFTVAFLGMLIFILCGYAFGGARVHPLLQKLRGRRNLINANNYRKHNTRGLVKLRLAPSGQVMVSVLGIGSEQAKTKLKALGANIPPAYNGKSIFTAELPVQVLNRVGEIQGLQLLKPATKKKKLLDISVPEMGLPYPEPSPYTGQDVIVGIVDTGIDSNHADFKDESGSSRILFLWDQLQSGNPPSGFDYGYEWTAADINAGLCTSEDEDGHGTHVGGIAAGNGQATGNALPAYRFVGVAPQADIIAVATTFYDSDILNAATYIFEKAEMLGKPAVVNNSYGGHTGPHDGTDPFDVALDSLSGPGQIVVVAAGNEGDDYIHHSGEVNDVSNSTTFKFVVPDYTPNPGDSNDLIAFDLWHHGADSFRLQIKTPRDQAASAVFDPVHDTNVFDVCDTNDGTIRIMNYAVGSQGKRNIYIEIDDSVDTNYPHPGNWEIILTGLEVNNVDYNEIHGWICWDTLEQPAYFDHNTGDNYYSIGSPGTAKEVITVGAYVTKDSWTDVNGDPQSYAGLGEYYGELLDIANFSSRGPTWDGRQKPDICAPGVGIISAITETWDLYQPDYYRNRVVDDGVHAIMQGTSMSAPHLTGVVALLLEQDPLRTPAGLKSIISSTAVQDGFYDEAEKWGAGKVNAASALGLYNDYDGDLITDNNDNCPFDFNPAQQDRNLDGWGDLCECIAANLNPTGIIEFQDYSIFAADWLQTGPALAGDINGDEAVDPNDLEILAYHWLADCSEE